MSRPIPDPNVYPDPNNETEYLKLLLAVGPIMGLTLNEAIARQRRLSQYFNNYWKPTFDKWSWAVFYNAYARWDKLKREEQTRGPTPIAESVGAITGRATTKSSS